MKASIVPQSSTAHFYIYLRIKHPTLDPAEITRLLDMQPEDMRKAGLDVTKTGQKRLHSETYWLALLPNSALMDEVLRVLKSESSSAEKLRALNEVTTGLTSSRVQDFAFFKSVFGQEVWAELQDSSWHDFALYHWLRQLSKHKEFFSSVRREQGSVSILLQLPERARPFRIRSLIARYVADMGVELEVDWAEG
jgi:hypothetical protein